MGTPDSSKNLYLDDNGFNLYRERKSDKVDSVYTLSRTIQSKQRRMQRWLNNPRINVHLSRM
jgi:hypothetical protein